MSHDLVHSSAVRALRESYHMDHERVARMCNLCLEQVRQLEQGGHDQFKSIDHKMQAALKVAATLSGVQANGLPKANVFRIRGEGMGTRPTRPRPPEHDDPLVFKPGQKFANSLAFSKLMTLLGILSFLMVAVIMPILFAPSK
jgi:transcriptional regulator with XRE-family HTH domain